MSGSKMEADDIVIVDAELHRSESHTHISTE